MKQNLDSFLDFVTPDLDAVFADLVGFLAPYLWLRYNSRICVQKSSTSPVPAVERSSGHTPNSKVRLVMVMIPTV